MNWINHQVQKFYRWKEMQRFKRAKKRADFLNELSGKKHLVIKLSGTYYIFNRDDLKMMKKQKKFRKLDWFQYENKAMYVANNRRTNKNQ